MALTSQSQAESVGEITSNSQPMIFAQSVSTKVRGSSLEPQNLQVKAGLVNQGRSAQTRSLNESR